MQSLEGSSEISIEVGQAGLVMVQRGLPAVRVSIATVVESDSMRTIASHRIRIGATTVIVAWAMITLVSSTSFFLDGAVHPDHTWFRTFLQFGTIWALWILIVPVVVWTARRFPVDRGRWPRAILAHLPISIIWAMIYFPLTLVVLRSWSGGPIFDEPTG